MHQAVVADRSRMGSGKRVHHLTVRRDGGVRTGSAVAGVLAVDDVGLASSLRLEADAQLLAGVGGVAVDEHVGRGEQPPEDLASRVRAQVEPDAALVAVDLDMGGAVTRHDLAEEVAKVVPHRWTFDLDHVGAEVTEMSSDGVAVEEHRRLDDSDAGKQLAHLSLRSSLT